jgi:hypothetical protein
MMATRPPIFVLLRIGRPTAIAWRVISVVVDAVKREFGGFFAHVGEKMLKIVMPSVANCDAAAAVVLKTFCIRVVAATEHLRPRAISCGPFSADCVAVFEVQRLGVLKQKTATGLCVVAFQVACADVRFSAARASAPPVDNRNARRTAVSMGNSKNSQTIKMLTCEVFQFGHWFAPVGDRNAFTVTQT